LILAEDNTYIVLVPIGEPDHIQCNPKENLIKFSLSTARSDKVAPDERANQAEDTGDDDRL